MRAGIEVSRLSGALAVKRVNGVPTVYPRSTGEVSPSEDLLQTVYDHGPVPVRISRMATAYQHETNQEMNFGAICRWNGKALMP